MRQACERQGDLMPMAVRCLIEVGERTGRLDITVVRAATHIERLLNLRRTVRSALVYPGFVLLTLPAVLVFWIVYVILAVEKLFARMGGELSAITRGIIDTADLAGAHLGTIAAVSVGVTMGTWLLVREVPRARRLVYLLAHRTPLVRNVLANAAMSRFCDQFGMLYKGGACTSCWMYLPSPRPTCFTASAFSASRSACAAVRPSPRRCVPSPDSRCWSSA